VIAAIACVVFGLCFIKYRARRNVDPERPSSPRRSMQGGEPYELPGSGKSTLLSFNVVIWR
jgi:hypothetical protein